MKRDMDIVRRILFAVEDACAPIEQIEDCVDSIFSYQTALLIEAGLVKGDVSDGPDLQPMAALSSVSLGQATISWMQRAMILSGTPPRKRF